ncbi:MAG: histidine phosphatase family protein [Phycisphaera sp.]|nr:MAG: histidine phosphatase family protein [Phycisphaera sp.]
MQVQVCRHAEAESQSVTGLDVDRPLTREGRLQARYLAGLLSGTQPGLQPRRLLASPAVRTQQTARAIADELGLSITTLDDLLPTCPAGAAIAAIASHADGAPVLLVGHNPTVTAVVSILLHGPSAGVHLPGPALRTGQMATIHADQEITPGECRLIDLHRYEPALAS